MGPPTGNTGVGNCFGMIHDDAGVIGNPPFSPGLKATSVLLVPLGIPVRA